MAEDTFSIDTVKEPTEAEQQKVDEVALLRRLKGWLKSDSRKRDRWRKEADADFAFVANDQWSDDDKKFMKDNGRVPVSFNRVLTTIQSIAGSEINGRLETRFLPRGVEDTKANELLSAASDWMSDQCDGEDEQSEAFKATLICGEGWTEARMSYDEDPQGMYEEVEVDPREIIPDCKSQKNNYSDARRVARVRKISVTEARAMFPDVSDEDLDAAWADHTAPGESKDPRPVEDKNHSHDDFEDPVEADRNDVTLVHMQYWEKEAFWLVAMEPDPRIAPGMQPQAEPEELDHEQYKLFVVRAKEAGIRYQSAKLMRRVYKQAFIGAKVLDHGPTPCPNEFSFNCITGERDRKNNMFFGLVRVMRDPQMWANKMLSNALHIANTTAKGGIIAEKNAFDDERQAESSYAQPNEITWAAEGGVQHGRIMPKPGTGDPSVYLKLLEFAIASIRDVTGVNLELLGLRDANQPGILEAQRKQAAMTVLASVFNSLRRFRKHVGTLRLYFIQEHLSDGRLIRIKGEDGAQTVPLIRDKTAGKYDVIVADAPTSPNQKEQTWQLIQQILPVFKDMLTPDVTLALLEYSPFPTDVVEKLRRLKQEAEQAQAPAQQAQQQQEQQLFMAQLRKLISDAMKNEATAQKTMAESTAPQLGAIKEQADAAKSHADAQKSLADAESARVQGQAAAMKTMAEAENTRMQGAAQAAEAESKSMYQAALDEAQLKKLIAETTKTTIETMMAIQQQQHEQSMAEKALEGEHELSWQAQADKKEIAQRQVAARNSASKE
jgi:hypothetical protein